MVRRLRECLTAGDDERHAEAGKGVDASKLGTSTRSDATLHVTFNGHPLYTYAGDSKSGQPNGEGVNGFGGAALAADAFSSSPPRRPASMAVEWLVERSREPATFAGLRGYDYAPGGRPARARCFAAPGPARQVS